MSRILHVGVYHRDLVRSFRKFLRYNDAGLKDWCSRELTVVMTNGDTHMWACRPERLRGMEFDAAIVDDWVDSSSVEDAPYLRDIVPTRIRPK